MVDYSVWQEFEGRKVRTLRDILPERPGVRALFVAKTPAHVSVEAGHYFQGKQGQSFWRQLRQYGMLHPRTVFEDESLLEHGFGLTDIAKLPRDYGSEPSSKEYMEGTGRILNLINLHKPIIVIFVYKRILDKVLCRYFKDETKAAYGFNPSLDHHFGAKVFVLPLPGVGGCTKTTIDSAMRELGSVLGYASVHDSANKDRQVMRSTREVADQILQRFEDQGWSQVPNYKRFGFIRRTNAAVIVSRENGQEARVPVRKIEQGILAVRSDLTVYADGPKALKRHGITHVNSVVWSLLHLVTEAELHE